MMRRGRPGGSDDDDDDDSDDEELRALRAARAGGGRTQDGPPDLVASPRSSHALAVRNTILTVCRSQGEDAFVSKPRSGGGGESVPGALEENEIEMAAVEDDTRLNFPMSFAQVSNLAADCCSLSSGTDAAFLPGQAHWRPR
eukprot:301272-Rhodomonas_salina.3